MNDFLALNLKLVAVADKKNINDYTVCISGVLSLTYVMLRENMQGLK